MWHKRVKTTLYPYLHDIDFILTISIQLRSAECIAETLKYILYFKDLVSQVSKHS